MDSNTLQPEAFQPRLRAYVEIIGGELQVLPIADSDQEAEAILQSFWRAVDGR